MDFNWLLDLLLKQIFGQPFILIGLIVLIGYLAMNQKFSKALTGALKAAIGIIVMGMGSGALIANFNKLIVAIQTATGITGAGLNTYPTMTAAYEKMDAILGSGTGASWGIYTLLVAFILNLIFVALRKYTKIRAVYLTGNAMIVQAGISTYIVWKFLGTGMIPTIIIASIITALYWGIFSTMLIKPTHLITGADFTVAHQQMFASYIAYKVAPFIGNPEKDDIEKKKLPASLNILQDNVIATALVMFLSVAIIFLVIGSKNIDWLRGPEGLAQAGLTNNLVFLFWITITLTANIYVLLAGVRMFVGEIMMSFKGISEKLLPGAVAGVDCAATFAFAPKSVVLGLVFGTVGQVLGLLGLIVFKTPIFLIPGFIPLFFDNATIAIFANKFGGWKAAGVICTLNGFVQIFGSMLAVQMTGLSWWQGSADYATVWVAIIGILKAIGSMLGIPVGA
ncbi:MULTISPECIES: PTS transporter subunit IIC [Erysipelotrichaceae]|uniref:PTS transporter subunit IIC n=1 Tax=Erysipelotrichaceae TaxID=128827 RepID=UPI000E3EF4AC|nr:MULTISPECIES: PTS transporter subunit IIC [unclassified Absiella]RGB64944.1 PTS ascorbate transporter subunit IIC [Absiella sp. AM09-45]RGB74150.1 PTS ascorbate transporter subunit IIC [Absiella sp. AM09-50]RGC51878.1 PTS ascorbate transporter subunit IIC [Absiella sp. AM29-15]